jgi:hypothetical protein
MSSLDPGIAANLAEEAILHRIAAVFEEFKAEHLIDIPHLNDKALEYGIDGLDDEALAEVALLVDSAIVEIQEVTWPL